MRPKRFKFTRFGLAENPLGHHVALPWKGRTLLGEVIGVYVEPVKNSIHLQVRHFNGESWPIEPLAAVVEVIG